ncbi:MAG: aldehyde dehydrogenase family protein [Microbacterium sp.]
MDLIRHHVAGQSTGSPERTGSVYDPATGAVQAEVAFASTAETDAAIAAAAAALPAWRATSLIKRADVFFRLRHLLVERADELAAIITAEHGKVLSDTRAKIGPRHRERRVRGGAHPGLLKGDASRSRAVSTCTR